MTLTRAIDLIASGWAHRNRPESMNTDWGQSLLAYGLLEASRTTGNQEAREHLRRWLTYHLGVGVHAHYFVGSWSIGLLYPEVLAFSPEFVAPLRDVAGRIYAFIREKAIRNGRGLMLHNVDLPHIYVDTVYYSAPIMAKLAAALGRADWKEDAMRQIDGHLEILRDPATGFFIHCQENLSERRSEGAWGRGNGWVAMTCAELIPWVAKNSPEGRRLRAILRDLVARLLPLQTRGGLWRTILNDRSSYEEVSASAMFLFSMIRGRRMGWLDSQVDDAITRGVRALLRAVDTDGRVLGVSEGTWPGTIDYYRNLERGEWWWGTGAVLLALCEKTRDEG